MQNDIASLNLILKPLAPSTKLRYVNKELKYISFTVRLTVEFQIGIHFISLPFN